jgi:Subtilase family
MKLRYLCASTLRAGISAVALLCLVLGASTAPASGGDWRANVARELQAIYASATTPQAPRIQPQSSYSTRYDSHGRLQVDVWFDCTISTPGSQLAAAGMVIGTTVRATPMCVVEGWVDVSAIPQLASLPGIRRVELPHYHVPKKHISLPPSPRGSATSAVGQSTTSAVGANTIDGNGITIMAADQYLTTTGASGAGVTVGVISDDVENIAVIQGRGELPPVNVVPPSTNPTPHSTFTDEGTMMLEEVHGVAPGAALAFCGPETYVEYLGCVSGLIAAGATIVSDDLGFPGYDTMSSQNAATQAVQTLLTSNPQVMLFTAAANNQQDYWQGPYTADNSSGASFVCNGQTDTYFESFGGSDLITWTLDDTSSQQLWLAWADPFGANVSNFDLYVFDAATSREVACAPGAGSTETFDAFPAGTFSAPGSYYLVIGTPNASLNGKFLKLMGFGDGGETFSANTSGAANSPQDFASGVFTVGAVDGSDGVGDTIEPYSNTGPIQLELPAPSTLQSPIVAAPDGILVDAVGTAFPADNGLFYGTSAASPNTAAVAALLRSAFPGMTPAATITAIETGATALGAYGAVPNGTVGYGRVNAMGALAAVSGPTVSPISAQTVAGGTSSPALGFTIGGTGALTLTATSDHTALVASSGISVGPSACPASTSACTLTITPVLGQVGTANITVTVTDGAQRTASTRFAVTVTKPAAPTVKVTGEASQTIAEGGTVTGVTFVMTGSGPLQTGIATSNASLLPMSSITLSGAGCGPTANQASCIANLSPMSGQSGRATITITVRDLYGQVGDGAATLQVNAPPSGGGGGGAIDFWMLLGLSSFSLRRVRRQTPGTGSVS